MTMPEGLVNTADDDLIAAARAVIAARYRPGWHVVGAALRLRSGAVVTGVNVDADIGRIGICAEAVALVRAVTELGSSDIDSIVAVHHTPDGRIGVVAPCGICREMVADDAPAARVLMPDGAGGPVYRDTGDRLPGKFRRPQVGAGCDHLHPRPATGRGRRRLVVDPIPASGCLRC
jgi:cytidine deaminase